MSRLQAIPPCDRSITMEGYVLPFGHGPAPPIDSTPIAHVSKPIGTSHALSALGELLVTINQMLPKRRDPEIDQKVVEVLCAAGKDAEAGMLATAAMHRCAQLELQVAELQVRALSL